MVTSDIQVLNPDTRIKIAVLGTRGFPGVQGGIETHCENLYTELAKQGCEITVFTRRPYVNVDIKSLNGIYFIHLMCLKNKFFETFLHTFIGVFAVKKYSPDILHIHAVGPSLFIPFARLLGMKVVMTNHGPDYQRKKWGIVAKSVLKLGEISGCRFANRIIAISKTISSHVKEKYGKEAVVIPNGVKIPPVLESDNVLKKYGLTKGEYILTVGRLVPEKGFHDLVAAFNKLISQNGRLVIVGKADHEDIYSRELKRNAGKNSKIIFTGFLTGTPLQELYSHAGLFVLPSYYEGLPIVLLEACSYGLSCLASDIAANKNVDLANERFFKPGNIDELTSKMERLIAQSFNDEEKKSQIDMIAQCFDWERIAAKTLKVYETVIQS